MDSFELFSRMSIRLNFNHNFKMDKTFSQLKRFSILSWQNFNSPSELTVFVKDYLNNFNVCLL